MRWVSTLSAVTLMGAAVAAFSAADAAELKVWAVDPHEKVFRDADPVIEPRPLALRSARNEYEPAQIVVRGDVPIDDLRVEISPLVHAHGKATLKGDCLGWNFVGYIPIKKNTAGSDRLQIRAAPCEIPDPLLETRSMKLAANTTQPVWITVRVPAEAAPGSYRGEVAVVAGDRRVALPIELTVDPFVLPDERHLVVTNWFSATRIAKYHKVEPWSEAFWPVLERYARNMAAHRHNVAYTPWTLVEVTRTTEGKLRFDYDRFDRYVELFEAAGAADRIELRHLGHFGPGGWSGNQIVFRKLSVTDAATGQRVDLDFDEGLALLLADLERHLSERGWLEKSMIHVADEPSINNIRSWRAVSAKVHKAAPGIRRMDAIETIDFSGELEVWVPKLSHFDRWREAYEARRNEGEFWFYICCHPTGNVYPNRFLDYPASCVRVLHWVNFSADLAGYLHWGLEAWRGDPFGPPGDRLPPGDTHVIYPGSEGPLDSIRWEIQRESLEDFEYLHLLTEKTAAMKRELGTAADWLDPARRAKGLCRRVVPSIADTERDAAKIMAARAAIADEIIALDTRPLLLVQTEPSAGSTLVEGPINVEIRGVTEPGAKLTINGGRVEVAADGTFVRATRPVGDGQEIVIETEHEGLKKTARRRFEIRK